MVVRAWVPRIRLWLVGGSTIANRLLSLYARLAPRVRRLRLWVRCALLFVDYQKLQRQRGEMTRRKKKGHTFTMTCETLLHHAVEYRARSDETLVHRH